MQPTQLDHAVQGAEPVVERHTAAATLATRSWPPQPILPALPPCPIFGFVYPQVTGAAPGRLPAVATAALRAQKARQAEERLAAADWADYGLVFSTHIGTPLMWRNVIRAFKAALKRAGLVETIRLHDLRHAHATLMLRAGVPLKVASGRLGHSSVGITADLYQHVADDLDTDAAERAAAALAAVK